MGQRCIWGRGWGLFCFSSCSGCSVKHIPRAAQGGSRLPQQPCKHPGPPAASQLVLEISLGKCSSWGAFTHQSDIFVVFPIELVRAWLASIWMCLGSGGTFPSELRCWNASGFAYHSLKSKQTNPWLWCRQCWGCCRCPWARPQPVPPSLCSPVPALPVPAHLGCRDHACASHAWCLGPDGSKPRRFCLQQL